MDILAAESSGDMRLFAEDYLEKLVGKLVKTLHLDKDVIFGRATEEAYRLRAEESSDD
jgi:hypothetical protein